MSSSSPKGGTAKQMVGPFILGKTLGTGTSGKVKLGVHETTGFRVAIKIVSKERLEAKPSMKTKMEREISILRLMDHEHVMKLYDVYETSRYLFLILEHASGGELFDYLVRRGRLPPAEALAYFHQIIEAIEYCHSYQICHRDLKPENLLLDANSRIKIADFGMAALVRRDVLLATSCGSPHYASPEIVRGVEYRGEPADIWSCGVILYALLAGRLPFDDNNIRKLLQKVKAGTFSFPRWFAPDIRDLISRMLTVDPDARITIAEIKAHAWFVSANPRSVLDSDAGAADDSVLEFTSHEPIPDDLDPEIVATLVTLGWGEVAEVTEALFAEEHNIQKVFYRLVAKRKAETGSILAVVYPENSGITASSLDSPTASGRGLSSGAAFGLTARTISSSADGLDIPMRRTEVGSDLIAGSEALLSRSVPTSTAGDHVGGAGNGGGANLFGTSAPRNQRLDELGVDVDIIGRSVLSPPQNAPLPFGSPRFHRHHDSAGAEPLVGSSPVSSSPKRSWFANLLGFGSSGNSAGGGGGSSGSGTASGNPILGTGSSGPGGAVPSRSNAPMMIGTSGPAAVPAEPLPVTVSLTDVASMDGAINRVDQILTHSDVVFKLPASVRPGVSTAAKVAAAIRVPSSSEQGGSTSAPSGAEGLGVGSAGGDEVDGASSDGDDEVRTANIKCKYDVPGLFFSVKFIAKVDHTPDESFAVTFIHQAGDVASFASLCETMVQGLSL